MLSACASSPTQIAYKCPAISLPREPELPISLLNDKSTPPEVMKSYVASVVALKKWDAAVIQQVSQ